MNMNYCPGQDAQLFHCGAIANSPFFSAPCRAWRSSVRPRCRSSRTIPTSASGPRPTSLPIATPRTGPATGSLSPAWRASTARRTASWAPTRADVPAMEQVSLAVTPTHTVYRFRAGQVDLTLTFFTPALAQGSRRAVAAGDLPDGHRQPARGRTMSPS